MRVLWALALLLPLHSRAENLWGDQGCQAYAKVFEWLKLPSEQLTVDQHIEIAMAMMRQCPKIEEMTASQCQQLMRENFAGGCADLDRQSENANQGAAGSIKTR